jgi:transposase
MSIDEVALSRDELYTVITNKDRKGRKGCLAALIKGTKSELVTAGLSQVPLEKKYAVKEITLDLANSMDWICRTHFPNANHTADRFHFQQVVSEAIQEIRIELRRKAIQEEQREMLLCRERKRQFRPETLINGDTKRQLLARGRYLLFKSSSNWTESQKERAKVLFEKYPELKKGYDLTMYFRSIFERKSTRETAQVQLEKWYEKINESGLETIISAAMTIKLNEGKILNYFLNRETNASAESFNSKLKQFRSLLRGVANINFFLFRVYKLFA